jgi:hypothetical protein
MVNVSACGHSEYLGAVELGRYISDLCFLLLVSVFLLQKSITEFDVF